MRVRFIQPVAEAAVGHDIIQHALVFLSARMSKSRAPRAERTNPDTGVRVLGFGGWGEWGHSTGRPNIHRSESLKRV